MRKWKIECSVSPSVGYYLIHNQKLGVSLNWFHEVKIDNTNVSLYDNNILSTYYSIKVLPKYIIKELKELPKKEE